MRMLSFALVLSWQAGSLADKKICVLGSTDPLWGVK